MATTITRNLKPMGEYAQWQADEMTNGDILGVYESLGNRTAHSVTVESIGGASTLRFNVIQKVHRPFEGANNSFVGLGQGAARRSAMFVGEVQVATSDIVVESGNIQTWTADEISVRDIEIVSKSSGLKITVS